ncbi:MAG: NADH:flavin oxidoreductase [candidate division NC10 bacterium]
MSQFLHLFSPIRIGNMEVPNRIVHVPTDISSSNADGSVSEHDLYHHGEIAKGGAGLIIVGATTPDAKTGRPTVTCLVADSDNFIPGLARLAESMHRYGAKCAVQLMHPGRQCAIPRYNTLSANDRVLKLPWSAGHEIVYENAEEKGKAVRAATTEEILELIELFSEAAWRVKQAGFDAVEVHAAHDSLLAQFMSPLTNQREDGWGGPVENRCRLHREVGKAVRDRVGREFPLLLKFGFEDGIKDGLDREDGLEAAALLAKDYDVLEVSQGLQGGPMAETVFRAIPKDGMGLFRDISHALKERTSVPVLLTGGIRDLEKAEQLIANKDADLIGMCRPFIRQPALVRRWLQGDTKRATCTSCNGCVAAIGKGQPLACQLDLGGLTIDPKR